MYVQCLQEQCGFIAMHYKVLELSGNNVLPYRIFFAKDTCKFGKRVTQQEPVKKQKSQGRTPEVSTDIEQFQN